MRGFKKLEEVLPMSSESCSNNIAIKLDGVSKVYYTYERPQDRLKQSIFPRLRKKIGLKDKSYHREFWSLRDVSFSVKKGETLGVIGQNGAGKSTLLQIICGTLSPTHGQVETHGRVAALLELGSGFNPEFTGRENIYMNASILGLSSEEIDEKYDAITAFADIGVFINQPVKTYSSGMVLRVAFAVIAHVDAEVLIIDEALAVGDAFFVQRCMRFLKKFMQTGTVLFVSHDTSAVVNLCDRAILLKNGQIISSGLPKDITKKYLSMEYERSDMSSSDNKAEGISVLEDDPILRNIIDVREDLYNGSTLRNDVEVFRFETPEDSFGTGWAVVEGVYLLDEEGRQLSWIVGGNSVVLEIICKANSDIMRPIIGFQVRDRLGQIVFADNTYLIYKTIKKSVNTGQTICARFSFVMPVLPSGDYSFSVAVADGTQEDHIQHHWVFDALVIKVHASHICHGLIGVPMSKIDLSIS